jgi:uncharacterized repeat protein (TIGR03837 family)
MLVARFCRLDNCPMRWDIFCRVVDNFGDIGVCWRLAAQLAALQHKVRLWVDDARPLQWLAPRGAPGVQLVHWALPIADEAPGNVVVEAFGCNPPAGFVQRMAARAKQPIWLNLEYLSAEAYVERSHGLPSPQQFGPGRGLVKIFFYPGFTPRTGGLLREAGLLARRSTFDGDAWLAARGWARRPGERVVTLFCYPGAPVETLVTGLADQATLLLLAGAAQAPIATSPSLRVVALPWLEQTEFDSMLWAADLNFVRGEDSFVRAMWAGAPFVWQIYPQQDQAHRVKLQAFVERFCAGASAELAARIAQLHSAWNGAAQWPAALPDAAAWRAHCLRWREMLAAQDDLCTQLVRSVEQRG